MNNFSRALLLLLVCTPAADSNLLRSVVKQDDVGALNSQAVKDRALAEDTNMDDYAQLELFNEQHHNTNTAPSVSEETGEDAIIIIWTDVSVPVVGSLSPTCLIIPIHTHFLICTAE
jgi:hypothetical protein